MTQTPHPAPTQPWWRYGHVWLIIAGPVIVVIAGFITLWLAVRTPDPVITSEDYRQAQTLQADPSSVAPAMQARNHAQTGVPTPPQASGAPVAKP
ncbi:MAG: FixH family protein [Hylemonella sp.]|uniref:FixH family protein n=1 Tax=Hylemonella sp. TaxID=2066020 RepID=UPI0022BB097B|nr:FixH family protein [Hylemonella sp.]MCZ8251455.1 FixH family protein [Hylemonella sp.]